MNRRTFVRKSAIAAGTAMTLTSAGLQPGRDSEKSVFELRVYHIARGGNNKGLLEAYFKQALIPLMAKHDAKVLAFDEYSLEEPVKVYVLIGYPSFPVYLAVQTAYQTDADYRAASESYNRIPASTPVYTRYETFLLEAFDRIPALIRPDATDKLFELRIYESPNEDAGNRKVDMFNKEEIDLFLETGLQPVFFGKILAGQYMPALIYMIALPDMEGRDPAWAGFSSSEEWATMRTKPEYADVVSNIRRIFLTPLDW